ncbi:MAG: response regulator transcription factor [Eubacterium sp.]|nr:response regulator transcription factor [Eubacterium sp.]
MRMIICDDEQKDAELTRNTIDGYRGITDIKVCTPEETVFDIEEGYFDYDIAILDIEYHKDINGIDVGHLINKRFPACQIIYLTKITDYASDVYETEHVYFVTKQNMQTTLYRAIDKAIDMHISNEKYEYIELSVNKKKLVLLQKSIMYLERLDRKIYIHTIDGKLETYNSLSEYSKRLSEDFVRCYGSFIVNLNYVNNVGREKIVMKNGEEIPVGRTYRNSMIRSYMKFLSRRL